MHLDDFKKNYLGQSNLLEHGKLVAFLSLQLFKKLIKFFPDLKQYDNKKDLTLLECGALLHDIGVIFEKKMNKGHHKIGRDLILDNKISGLDEVSNLIVANIVRYHRKALPNIEGHRHYGNLSFEDRKKVDIFASIVRICDAIDFNHLDMVNELNVNYDKNLSILTISIPVNIMLNIGYDRNLAKKKDFLEKTLGVEVLFD